MHEYAAVPLEVKEKKKRSAIVQWLMQKLQAALDRLGKRSLTMHPESKTCGSICMESVCTQQSAHALSNAYSKLLCLSSARNVSCIRIIPLQAPRQLCLKWQSPLTAGDMK
jgi:hypothetical protein